MKMLAFLFLVCAGMASAESLVVHNGRLFMPANINGIATEALLDKISL